MDTFFRVTGVLIRDVPLWEEEENEEGNKN